MWEVRKVLQLLLLRRWVVRKGFRLLLEESKKGGKMVSRPRRRVLSSPVRAVAPPQAGKRYYSPLGLRRIPHQIERSVLGELRFESRSSVESLLSEVTRGLVEWEGELVEFEFGHAVERGLRSLVRDRRILVRSFRGSCEMVEHQLVSYVVDGVCTCVGDAIDISLSMSECLRASTHLSSLSFFATFSISSHISFPPFNNSDTTTTGNLSSSVKAVSCFGLINGLENDRESFER